MSENTEPPRNVADHDPAKHGTAFMVTREMPDLPADHPDIVKLTEFLDRWDERVEELRMSMARLAPARQYRIDGAMARQLRASLASNAALRQALQKLLKEVESGEVVSQLLSGTVDITVLSRRLTEILKIT
jgi:hypothetical protein